MREIESVYIKALAQTTSINEVELQRGFNSPASLVDRSESRSEEQEAKKGESGDNEKKVSIITIVKVKSETNTVGSSLNHGHPPSHAAILEHDGKTRPSRFQRFKGLLAIFIATAILALNPQILYYERERYGSKYSNSDFLMWMYAIYSVQNLIPAMFATYMDPGAMYKPFVSNPKLIIAYLLRGMCGSVVLLLIWGGVGYFKRTAPVAVIMAMCPLFVYINAFFVLGEQIGWITVLNALIAFAGVIVMNFDGGIQLDRDTWLGTLMSLLAMYLLSWVTVLVRILKEVHPLVVNLAFGCFGILVQGSISYFTGTFRTFEDGIALLLCFSIATCATLGNFGYNIALKNEQAGVVALVRTTEVIFSFVYQFIFFDIPPKKEK
ncbi:unnamed protein product [Orchesella dallaii]|uniref:Uncharacterized protein n=1 Tax=Orchesella dallaii TaxID=48710 RepID=A0ABP1RN81_9HEXA